MSDQHRRFLERLAASSEAVFAVAKWLNRQGKTVQIPHISFAPTAADADLHVDDGDLFVIERKRVEVKRLGVDFTGRDDWPFKEAFVSNKAAVDRSFENVSAWIFVSSDLLHAAVVTPSTREHWYLKKTMAKNTGNEEEFYACPLEHVTFRKIS